MFEEGIRAFWEWWQAGGRQLLESAIAGEEGDDLPGTISGLVSDIHPSLQWQLAPGMVAEHSLALSGGGLGTLRIIAQQWAEGAPDEPSGWEFHGARIPIEPPYLTIEGVALDPTQLTWVAEEDTVYEQLDVGVFVPGFEVLDDAARMQAILTYLDAVLGEDKSETWIGIIEPLAEPPRGGRPLRDLADRVASYAATTTGEGWEIIEMEEYGAYTIATINRALKHLHHLDKVLHCEIIVGMNDTTQLGLPTDVETADQGEIEDDALETIGDQGIFLGRETIAGHRHLHFFVKDSETFAEDIADWAEEFDSHAVEAIVTLDPDWSILNRWL